MGILKFFKRYLFVTYLGLVEPFREMFAHRYLLLLLAKRDIYSRTSGTLLGSSWLLLQPALQVVGFWFLLDIVLKVKFKVADTELAFASYFVIGILPWLFISEILMRSLSVLTEYGSLYQRSIFPIAILPLLPLSLSTLLYLIIFVITVIFISGINAIGWAILTIILIMFWLIPFCYLLSIIGLFLKDIAQFFPFLITLVMYLTPIMYMPNLLPESMNWVLIFNPIADMMALIHAAFLPNLTWEWINVWRPLGIWLILLGPAWVLFRRAEPHVREML
jgi:lipopolysaccharide transport system permease protein